MSFTWAYPSGRLPVLAPIRFQPDGFPVLVKDNATGAWGASYPLPLPRKPTGFPWTRKYDFTTLSSLPATFEWNHNPDTTKYSLSAAGLTLSTASVTADLYAARNTLTHRIHGERPVGTLELDFAGLADGDRAGLAAFRDRSAWIGVQRTGDRYEIAAVFNMTLDEWSGSTLDLGRVVESVEVPEGVRKVWLRVSMDARASGDKGARFEYSLDSTGRVWNGLGGVYELYTGWAFFLGYRFGVFNYATKGLGGSVRVVSFTSE
ncbi:hypothetical protein VTI74DRAFT_9310 [Chaetomium olivicolor]